MRKIKYFLLAFILGLTCFSPLALTGCGKKLNWNGLSIAGFDDFVSIGAVSFEDKNIVYADEKNNSPKMKLAGFDADGVCKQITFEDEKGKKSKQKANLLHFDAYENYTIVSFTTNKDIDFVNLDSYYYTYWDTYYFSLDSNYTTFSKKDCFMFIIDNANGKIYDMRHIVDAVKDVCQYKNVCMNFANLSGVREAMYGSKAYNDPFILLSVQENVDGRTSRSLCKVDFQDNNVKVAQKMNYTQMQNFNQSTQVVCDRYGHIFSCSGLNADLLYVDRYQKLDGTFVEARQDAQYKFGTNSILYMWRNNKTYYLNGNDEFEEIDFNFGKIICWSNNFHTYNGYL